jgi:hypothetical protein
MPQTSQGGALMNKTRQVKQHVRWKTVHELDFNGDTLCGNGRRDGYASYTTLSASAVAGQKACLGCAGRAARRASASPAAAKTRAQKHGFQP